MTTVKTTARVDTAASKFIIEIERGELIVRDRWNKITPITLMLEIHDADFLAETIRAAIAEYARMNDEVARGMMRLPMEGAK